jgi:hypothetical protein
VNVLAFRRNLAATEKVLQALPLPSVENSSPGLFSGSPTNQPDLPATVPLANSKATPSPKANQEKIKPSQAMSGSVAKLAAHRGHAADSQALDILINEAVNSLTGRSGQLVRIRVAGLPGVPARPLAEFIGAFADGLLAVVESSPDGLWEHSHGLVLVGSRAEAQDLIHAAADHFGLSRSAQHTDAFKGFRGFQKTGDSTSLRRNLYNLLAYDLCVLKHSTKRSREIPLAVVATGALATLAPLAEFALDPDAVKVAPVRLCGAPCPSGKPCSKRLLGRQHSCSPTCRSRRSRAATEATPLAMSGSVAGLTPLETPEPATPSEMSESVTS